MIAKSHLGPMKYTSVARSELEAAVLSTKMSVLVKKQFGFVSLMGYYWTNSQVVIGYLTNTPKRYKIFVAHHLQQIKESIDVLKWHYQDESCRLFFKGVIWIR